MINKILKNRFPFVSHYFETLIESCYSRFPQSVVFEGLDITGQYLFSMELARILNCEEAGMEDCSCINCSWIREAKHPAVNVVSPINYKDDASKTVISIGQAKKITASLRETSDYHRFFIFCDAKIKQPNALEEKLIQSYAGLGFRYPEENWIPGALNMKIFKTEASNSLLKSIEEPPARTTFVFLTRHREDLISTIVSRSNVFRLNSPNVALNHKKADTLLKNYPGFSIREALDMTGEAENLVKSGEADIFDILDEIQEHILDRIKQNIGNNRAFSMFQNHIKLVNKAKIRLRASMSTKVVLESLFLDMAAKK